MRGRGREGGGGGGGRKKKEEEEKGKEEDREEEERRQEEKLQEEGGREKREGEASILQMKMGEGERKEWLVSRLVMMGGFTPLLVQVRDWGVRQEACR